MPALTEPVVEPLVTRQTANMLCNDNNDLCDNRDNDSNKGGRDFLVSRRHQLTHVSRMTPTSLEPQELHEFQRIRLRHIELNEDEDDNFSLENFRKLSRGEREAFLMKHRHLLRHVEHQQHQQEQRDVILDLKPAPVKSILKDDKNDDKDNKNEKNEKDEMSKASNARVPRPKSKPIVAARASTKTPTRSSASGGFLAPTQAWLWHVGQNSVNIKKSGNSNKENNVSKARPASRASSSPPKTRLTSTPNKVNLTNKRRRAPTVPPRPKASNMSNNNVGNNNNVDNNNVDNKEVKKELKSATKTKESVSSRSRSEPRPRRRSSANSTHSLAKQKPEPKSEPKSLPKPEQKPGQKSLPKSSTKPPVSEPVRKSSLQSKLNRRLKQIEDSHPVEENANSTSKAESVINLDSTRVKRANSRGEMTINKNKERRKVHEIAIPAAGVVAERTTMVVRVHPGHSRRLSNCSSVSKEESATFTADVMDGEEQEVRAGLEIKFESLPQTIDIRLIPDTNEEESSRKTSNVSHVDVANDQDEADKTRQ